MRNKITFKRITYINCILTVIASLIVLTSCSSIKPIPPEPKCNNIDTVINSKYSEIAPFIYNNNLYFTRMVLKNENYKDSIDKKSYIRHKENYLLVSTIADSCIHKDIGCCTESYDMSNAFGKPKIFLPFDRTDIKSLIKGSCFIVNNTIYFTGINHHNSEQFDIYSWDLNNLSSYPKVLHAINTDNSWEAHPTLNNSENLIIFTSNRNGKNQLWYSFLVNGFWTTPQRLIIKGFENCNVETPNLNDNTLFFSSDKNGNYDIYVCKIKYNNNTLNVSEETINPIDDVNTPMDEKFPYYYEKTKYLFYSSNFGNNSYNFDIKYKPYIKKGATTIIAEYTLIKKDAEGNILRTIPKNYDIKFQVLNTNCPEEKIKKITDTSYILPPSSEIKIQFNIPLENNPCSKKQELKCIVYRKFGTLNQYSEVTKDNFYMIKTSCDDEIIKFECIIEEQLFNIVTFNISSELKFFVTGYWRPNVSINKKHTIYGSKPDNFTETAVSLKEFKVNDDLTLQNDEELNRVINSIKTMVDQAVACNLYVKIKVYGFTDERRLTSKYIYNGKGIPVGFDLFGEIYQIENRHPNVLDSRLRNNGQFGNIVLSKLRAYYTFLTIDKMLDDYPNWKTLKSQNRILLDCEGFGIDNRQREEGYAGNRHAKIFATFGNENDLIDPFTFDINNNLMSNASLDTTFRKLRTLIGFNKDVDSTSFDDKFYDQKNFEYKYIILANKSDLFTNNNINLLSQLINNTKIEQITSERAKIGQWNNKDEAYTYIDSVVNLIITITKDFYNFNTDVFDPNTYYSVHIYTSKNFARINKIYHILINELNINEDDIVLAKTTDEDGNAINWRIRSKLFKNRTEANDFLNKLYDKFNIERFELFELKVIEMKERKNNFTVFN